MPNSTATISLIGTSAPSFGEIRAFLNALPRNPQTSPLIDVLTQLQQALDQVQQVLRAAEVTFNQLMISSVDIYDPNQLPLLGFRQPAITAPTGGGTVDAQARTAINALIAALSASSSSTGHHSLIG